MTLATTNAVAGNTRKDLDQETTPHSFILIFCIRVSSLGVTAPRCRHFIHLHVHLTLTSCCTDAERGGEDAHVVTAAPAVNRDTGTCTHGAHDCRARRVRGLKLAEVLRETG